MSNPFLGFPNENPVTEAYKTTDPGLSFHYTTTFTMKPQTVFVLVSLIGMLLTLQQVEGDLGHIAIQSVGNVAFNSLSIFFIFQTKL